jgi:type IV pilus assembly protein PilA
MKLTKIKTATQKGFTLIELMITVAIVAILAAVALPAYQDYTIRAQVSEGFQLANGIQTGIAEYYAQNGSYPATNATLGQASVAGKYVSAVTSAANVVTVAYGGPQANTNIPAGATVTFTANDPGTGALVWTCAIGGTMQQKYVPSSCK